MAFDGALKSGLWVESDFRLRAEDDYKKVVILKSQDDRMVLAYLARVMNITVAGHVFPYGPLFKHGVSGREAQRDFEDTDGIPRVMSLHYVIGVSGYFGYVLI